MEQPDSQVIDGDGPPVPGDSPRIDWHRRVVGRSLKTARQRSIDRGASLIEAAATLLERSEGDSFTVQDIADEAGQSLRTLYQYFESKDDLLLAVFEEAMRAYAELISNAISDLDEPVERLAGAVIAASSMADHTPTQVDAGLSRLRLRLGQVQPELVARSQAPVSDLVVDLVTAAIDTGTVPAGDPQAIAFQILALNASFVVSQTLGNDYGVGLPDAPSLARFCLGGMGVDAARAADLVDGMLDRLHMPAPSKRRTRTPR